ncbi:MFS transporter [Nocardia sp. NPDC004415]
MTRVLKRAAERFAVLSVRNFRLFVAGQLASVTGTWMMIAAQDWLVLELTHGSASALALVTVCQFAPAVFVSVGAGLLADRMAKRSLLIVLNAAAGLVASAQATIVVSGGVQLWHLYLLALVIGIVNAIETPVRMAFIGEIVGEARFRDASSLSAMYFSVAQLVGPAIAGVLIAAFGTGTALAVNAVSYAATIAGLALMRRSELRSVPRAPRRFDMLRGLRCVRDDPHLTGAIVLLAVVGLFALNLRVTAPLLAKTVFDATPAVFGAVSAALACGSLFAAMFLGGRGAPSPNTAIGCAVVLGTAEAALGLMSSVVAAMVLLAVCGAAMTMFLQTTNHFLQLSSPPADRTQVIALYTTVVQGITPLAALGVGVLADRIDVRVVVSLSGAVAAGLACAGRLARRRPVGGPREPEDVPLRSHPEPTGRP